MSGQASWRLATDHVEAFVTKKGGHLAPVTFRVGSRNIQPFSIAPWAEEPASDLPGILECLRGDFFCMPFGANETAYQGEVHPLHGETANEPWSLEELKPTKLLASLNAQARAAKVQKSIELRPGQHAIYCKHTITGATGPMCLGHHAMLKFNSEGLISTSPFGFGQVFPDEFESPAKAGYSSLQQGARFSDLKAVPTVNGKTADLTRYPAREGFEDLVMIYSKGEPDFAWNAVAFPEEAFIYFALRDPQQLSGTILWHSNGGRHYHPWNGRHRAVLGIEDVTSYMHYGLAESTQENDASREGYPTTFQLSSDHPTTINYIMGVAAIPTDFGRVKSIHRESQGISLESETGKTVSANVDHRYLSRG